MALSKRVMALSVAVVGTSATAVVAPAEPASAHEVSISRGGAWARVGPNHSGIEVCITTASSWDIAYATVKGPQVTTDVSDDLGPGCNSRVIPGGIQVFRLCHSNAALTRHTCTDFKTVT